MSDKKKAKYELFFEETKDTDITDWDYGNFSVEDLYQAFKERLTVELFSRIKEE